MKLTGKCKEEFEKWLPKYIISILYDSLEDNEDITNVYEYFKNYIPDAMKYGVMVDFFDSVGITIVIDAGGIRYEDNKEIWYQSGVKGHKFNEATNSRQEARSKAIEKANQIFNK